jgi:hypothetical protein
MFAALHSDINSLKSGLLHLTDQPNSQKGRSAKVKDGIISETIFLGAQLIDSQLICGNIEQWLNYRHNNVLVGVDLSVFCQYIVSIYTLFVVIKVGSQMMPSLLL